MPWFNLIFLFILKVIIPDIGIKTLVEDGFLPPTLTIGRSSVDLTLSDSFSWPEQEIDKIILGESVPYKQVQNDEFVLEPNHFVLASTAESIHVPHDMALYVKGRSSIGRSGLQVQNVDFFDAGFHGQITLELENQSWFPIV